MNPIFHALKKETHINECVRSSYFVTVLTYFKLKVKIKILKIEIMKYAKFKLK